MPFRADLPVVASVIGVVGRMGQEGQGQGTSLSLFPFLPLIAWHHPALHLTFAFAEKALGEKHLFYTSR